MKKVLYTLLLLCIFNTAHALIVFHDITPNGNVIYNAGSGTPYSFTVLGNQYNLKYDGTGFHFYATVPTDNVIGAVTGSGDDLDGYTGAVDHITPTSSDWTNDAYKIPSFDWSTMLAFRIPAGSGNYKYAWLWISLDVNTSVTVFQYGYENVNNTQILAGQMSGGASEGIEEESALSTRMYPNPASHFVTIENTGLEMIEQVEIFDLSGKTLYNSMINSHKLTVDISAFVNGVYMVQARLHNGKMVVKKMIVE